MAISLDELVNQSEKLLSDITTDTDVPRISRSLEQMRSLGQKLHLMRGSKSEVKAARLLGAKMSYELPSSLSSKMENIDMKEPTLADMPKLTMQQDIQSFLKSQREQIILDAIESSQTAIFQSIQAASQEHYNTWWNEEMNAILGVLSGTPNQPIMGHQLDSFSVDRFKSQNKNYQSGQRSVSHTLTGEELTYLKRIHDYQQVTVTSLTPSEILTFFAEVVKDLDTPYAQMQSAGSTMCEIWSLVKSFLEPSLQILPKRCDLHADKVTQKRLNGQFSRSLIVSAIDLLADDFIKFMRISISKQPTYISRIGGKPAIRDIIRAFYNLTSGSGMTKTANKDSSSSNREFEDGLVDSVPVWAMIYYCLRTASYDDAVDVAEQASRIDLGKFASYLRAYADNNRLMPVESVNDFKQNYRHIMKNSRDIYKQAVFCLLSRHEFVDSHAEVIRSADDFIWFKLSQTVLPDEEQLANEQGATLLALQTLVHDTYGEQHFQASEQPLLYFKLLLFTQQFEAMIAFFSRVQENESLYPQQQGSASYLSHGLHLAICLGHMGLLLMEQGETSMNKPLLSQLSSASMQGLRTLNFPRLLMMYTQRFELRQPMEAIDYLILLFQQHQQQQPNVEAYSMDMFVTCLTELLLEVQEFDPILGSFDVERRQPGAMTKFCAAPSIAGVPQYGWQCPRNICMDTLLLALAKNFENRGRELESIKAYLRLSGSAISKGLLFPGLKSVNTLLANFILSTSMELEASKTINNDDTMALQQAVLLPLATQMALRVRNCSQTANEQERCLFLLLDLCTFVNLVRAGNWQTALDCLNQLGNLIPGGENQASMEAAVANYQNLSELLKRPLPNIILGAMQCLVGLAQVTGANKNLLQAKARALISFMGRIPQRVAGDIYTKLTKMEASLLA